MRMKADKCDRCGKIVVTSHDHESSDMVETDGSFLYFCDIKPGEVHRPSLQLQEYGKSDKSRAYCLDCLLEVVREWVEEMKKRGPSKIPLDHIIFPLPKYPSSDSE